MIVGTQEFAASGLSPGQTAALGAMADHFQSQIIHYNRELSALLVTASADALGGAPEELNNTLGCGMASSLNELTAHLITVGKTHLASVESAEDENILLEALRSALASRDFSLPLVDRFTAPILAYIRALEQSSACGDVVDTLTDVERGRNQVNQRYVSQMSNTGNTGRSVSSHYPHAASQSVASDEELDRFLEEIQGPLHSKDARDIIRDILRTLRTEYEPWFRNLRNPKDRLPVNDEVHKKELLRSSQNSKSNYS